MKRFSLLMLATLLVTFTSCVKDNETGPTVVDGDGQVTLTLATPGNFEVDTRAQLPQADEAVISGATVIVFAENGVYDYHKTSTSITSSAGNVKVKVNLRSDGAKYDILVLTNLNSFFTDAQIKTAMTGANINNAYNKLQMAALTKDGWNGAKFVMSGIIKGFELKNTVIDIGTISLIRSLASVDVGLNWDGTKWNGLNNFKLEEVFVYNANKFYTIMPEITAYENTSYKSVITPTIYNFASSNSNASSLGNTAATALHFDSNNITIAGAPLNNTGNGQHLSSKIYIPEVNRLTLTNPTTYPALIIGGKFNNEPTSYYRLDFAKTNADGTLNTYLDILRNYKYRFNIKGVQGSGYATPDEAFDSKAINIVVNVQPWDQGDVGDVIQNGQNRMGVSPSVFDLSKESSKNTITIKTDTSKPTVTYSTSATNPNAGKPAWITQSSYAANGSGSGLDFYKLDFNVAINNGAPRTAYIFIKAGILPAYVVTVNQSDVVISAIDITDIANNDISILEFTAAKDVQPAMQQFKLRWSPTAVDVLFTKADIKNAFIFDGAFDVIPGSGTLNDPSGTLSYSIRPTAITTANLAADPFYERFSTVLYTITDGVKTATKALVLRQLVYNIVPKIEPVYMMDGTGKSFSVRSNSPFIVTLKTNPNNVVSGLTTTGVANTTAAGTPVNFTIIDALTNPTLFQKDVVVTLKSPGGLFPDTDVTLNCTSGIIQPKSNSYIVAPGGVGILIPVDRANESMLGNQLGVNEAFTANLVWTDNVNKIADNSNIKMIRAVGSGTGGYILVVPGSVRGNAVVAIKNAANKILWSWHIWVTGYNPAPIGTGKFMDRNLGAFSNTSTATVTDISAKGLLYQWGRKDPFPGSTTLSANIEPTLYTATGTTVVPRNNTVVANNFANTVRNPEMFYYSAIAPYDWYTNGGAQNDALWGPASKTVYDPCPDEWRVPQIGVWATLTTTNFPWGDYGRTATNHGGFYPAAGYRYNYDGTLVNAGAGGYYWSATFRGVNGYNLYFNSSSNVNPSSNNYRAYGLSVRCVQE